MRIGCCAELTDYLTVKEQGFDYIELSSQNIMRTSDEDFRDFLRLYQETYFPCIAFNSLCNAEFPLVGPLQDLSALKDYMSRLCERGGELGIQSIGVGAPDARKPPQDWPEQRSDEQMLAFLEMACAVASPYGIRILLEAVNNHVCGYLHHTSHAVRLLGQLSARNSGLVLDYYHARLMDEAPEKLGYAMPLVRHIHVSGGEYGTPRFFLTTEQDEENQQHLYACAQEQHYPGDSVSIEANRLFLPIDGKRCRELLQRCWKASGTEEK